MVKINLLLVRLLSQWRYVRMDWSIMAKTKRVCILLGLVIPGVVSAVTVKSTADSGGACPGATCTLRQAIVNAGAGGTINFSLPANSTITLTSELAINANLTISGPGANLLTVQRTTASGAPHFRIFSINSSSNVAISGLTIANGSSELGGGIINSGTLTLTSCTISGNAVTDSGMTSSSQGGGIYNSGTANIVSCTITGNTSQFKGGGIYNGNTMTIVNSTISGNSGFARFANTYGGGVYTISGTATIASSTITGNSATAAGGIMIASGTVKLTSTIIARNTASVGRDIYGSATSQGFNFVGNSSDATMTATTGDQFGTGASPIDPMLGPLQDNGGPTKTHALLPDSSAIEAGNSTGFGTDQRGFSRPVDSPTIPNVGNGADIGAYEVQADSLPGCNNGTAVVTSNSDGGPGSLRGVIATACADSTISFADNVRGTINLTSDELLINKSLAINGPGANLLSVQRSATVGTPAFRIFEVAPASVVASISGLTIANGSAGYGGGILSSATLTITGCALSGNSAGPGGGGLCSFQATVSITDSAIFNNTATAGFGGGLYYAADASGTLTITNSTISGNSAKNGNGGIGAGGGIFCGTANLNSCTIAGNTADYRGGGVYTGGSFNSRNTIVALNTAPAGPDVYGTLTSQDFNLIGNDSGVTITPAQIADQTGTAGSPLNPLLGPLQDNGGPTFTRALLAGSTAIDKGNSSGSSTDQRGFPRPVGSAKISGGDGGDIGAFEFGSSLPTPTPSPTATPTVTPTATPTSTPTATAGLVGNVSTRLPVGTDDNALIEGFIVQGPAGSTKKMMVRAIGPSLLSFGIGDALANPTLEIHDASGATVATNDNWRTTQQGGLITGDQSAEISGSGVAPGNDLESAIIANLAPGNYTAVVRGLGNTVGTGVVDAYDLSAASPAKLANIATRGLIQPGDKLMIAGFIVQNGPVKAVIRAIGPSLSAFGITNALADTTLQLRDVNGAIVGENDNWQSDPQQAQELQSIGLQPSNDLEAALIATIPPGQYTAQVRGKPETTGIGVVQVYFLQ
jgi:hypothetical protein